MDSDPLTNPEATNHEALRQKIEAMRSDLTRGEDGELPAQVVILTLDEAETLLAERDAARQHASDMEKAAAGMSCDLTALGAELTERAETAEAERDAAVKERDRMEECDCVPLIISSRACPKCGRRGVAQQGVLDEFKEREATLTRYQDALEQIAAMKWTKASDIARAAFDGPKEEQ